MNSFWGSVREVGQTAWVKFLARLNAFMLLGCSGLIMLNQTNPKLVDSLVKSLTPTEQALAGFGFCCLVQFALHRVKKTGDL